MKEKCHSQYLIDRIDKCFEKLEQFKANTGPNLTVHQVFKYVFSKNKDKLDNSILKNKYSDLQWVNMTDCQISEKIDLGKLQQEVENCLREVELEEQHITRLIDKSRHYYKDKLISHSLKKQETQSGCDKSGKTTIFETSKVFERRHTTHNPNIYQKRKICTQEDSILATNDDVYDFDSVRKDIKHLSEKDYFKADKFPKLVKEKHKQYEDIWKSFNHECHKKANRNFDNTQQML